MAKRGKLSYQEATDLQNMSLEDLQANFYKKMQQERGAAQASAPNNSPTSPPSSDESPMDLESIMAKYEDPATGEARMPWADGSSPNSAINKSPVDLLDRAKLSTGNVAGRIKYLKEKFSDVQKTKSGLLAVQDKDGLWYNVDPENLGEGSPYDKMKEAVADYGADILPELLGTAASIGAAVATGGASIPAQVAAQGAAGAGLGSAKVIMGKLLGTYEATPEEVMKDIALETVIGAGGALVGAGVGYSIPKIGAALKSAASGLSKLNPASMETIAKMSSISTKVPEEDIMHWMTNASDVGDTLIKYGKGKIPADAIAQNIHADALSKMPDISSNIWKGLNKFYEDGMEEVAKSAGNHFNPNIDKGIKQYFGTLAKSGWGSIDDSGRFVLNSFDDLSKAAASNSEIFTMNETSYKFAQEMVKEVNKFVGLTPVSGPKGAKNLVAFTRQLENRARNLNRLAFKEGGGEVRDFINTMINGIDGNISLNLSSSPAYPRFKEGLVTLKSQYSSIKNNVSQLLNDHDRYIATGAVDSFSNSFDKIFNGSLKSTKADYAKWGFGDAIEKLSAKAPQLKELVADIKNLRAARATLPVMPPGLMGQMSVGAVVPAVASGNPAFLAPAVAMSPRANYEVIKRLAPMLQGAKFVKGLAPAQRNQFFNNPKLLQSFYTSILQAPEIHNQVKQRISPNGQQ